MFHKLLLALTIIVFALHPVALAETNTLENSKIKCSPTQELSTKTLKKGDTIVFEVKEDIKLTDSTVIIPVGTKFSTMVKESKSPHWAGLLAGKQPAHIIFEATQLKVNQLAILIKKKRVEGKRPGLVTPVLYISPPFLKWEDLIIKSEDILEFEILLDKAE